MVKVDVRARRMGVEPTSMSRVGSWRSSDDLQDSWVSEQVSSHFLAKSSCDVTPSAVSGAVSFPKVNRSSTCYLIVPIEALETYPDHSF